MEGSWDLESDDLAAWVSEGPAEPAAAERGPSDEAARDARRLFDEARTRDEVDDDG